MDHIWYFNYFLCFDIYLLFSIKFYSKNGSLEKKNSTYVLNCCVSVQMCDTLILALPVYPILEKCDKNNI